MWRPCPSLKETFHLPSGMAVCYATTLTYLLSHPTLTTYCHLPTTSLNTLLKLPYTYPSVKSLAKWTPLFPYRCKLPNVDPATGIKHKVEPDHSLRKFRNIDEGAPKSGCFGMQLCPIFPKTKAMSGPEEEEEEDLALSLEVGMELKVLQRGPHLAL